MRLLACGVALSALLISACSTLNSEQKTQYDLMDKDGLLVKEKAPSTGAWLGLLPGGGSFYGREPLVGVVDLLLWPASILWDPIVGYETAKKVNYNLTVSAIEREKQKQLSELDNQHTLKTISDAEFVTQKKTIEQKYDFGNLQVVN